VLFPGFSFELMPLIMDSLLETVVGNRKEQFCVEIMKRLDIQRRNEHFCDVILDVGSGDDQAQLKAHRIVLCATSPFFYNALNSDMKEKDEGVIRLKEISKAVMEEVLEFLYTGHVDVTQHNAYELFAQADYFLIPSLKVLCGTVILRTLSLSNCVMNYYFAMKYQWEELQRAARRFILANFVAVAETEDFLNLSSKQVEEWISSDKIIVKGEEEVFEVVMKWIQRGEGRDLSLVDLFRHIRFIYVPRDYLLNIILTNPFVRDNLDCSNLVLDAVKMVFGGTEDCYFAQSPRNCLKTHEDAIVACGLEQTLGYIPLENKWYKLANTLSGRPFLCQNVSSCQGKMYFIGGNVGGRPAECYDPALNTWSPLTSFNQGIRLAAAVTFQGILYLLGGEVNSDGKLKTVQRYNPDTNVWHEVAPLNSKRSGICAVADRNFLYAIGGINGGQRLDVVERFDPKERSWARIASTIVKRVGAAGAAVNEKVFVFGGIISGVTEPASCEMYDPASDTWSLLSTVSALRGSFVSVSSFSGKIFVCGYFGQDCSEGTSLYVYDAVTSEWKSCTNVPLGQERCKISRLRIPRVVLDRCEVVSLPQPNPES